MKRKCPQDNCTQESTPSVIAGTGISEFQLDNTFRTSVYSLLQNESDYTNIIEELSMAQMSGEKRLNLSGNEWEIDMA